MSLDRFSAPFAAGAINSDGLRKLLGASDHDPLSLLVRETIQNSWDASLGSDERPLVPGEVPRFTMSLRTADPDERTALAGLLGTDPVPGLPGLSKALTDEPLRLLEVADENTSGLGGPVDNRVAVDDDIPTDFVDLVFNIGAPKDTDFGGGTFGFGKIATYAMSACATVLIFSRAVDARPHGEPERLIGSAIGDSFDEDGLKYTGRHWWGRWDGKSVVPVTGAEATSAAEGVFRHLPGQGRTGTSLLVVAPDIENLTDSKGDPLDIEGAAQRMLSALLWSAWPKLMRDRSTGRPSMDVHVLLEDQELEIPDPRGHQPFSAFAHSLDMIRDEQAKPAAGRRGTHGWELQDDRPRHTMRTMTDSFDSKRPAKQVGLATVTEMVRTPQATTWEGDHVVAESHGVTNGVHHLAMMRQAELVVRYLAGPVHPDSEAGLSWGGVFKCEPDVDEWFSLAEPPSHDEWHAGGLQDFGGKVFVKRGRETGPRELFRGMFTADGPPTTGRITEVARIVGTFLGGIVDEGEAVSARHSNGRGGGGTRRPPLEVAATPDSLDGSDVIVVDVTGEPGDTVLVEGVVALAGGGSGDNVDVLGAGPPDGSRPTVPGGRHSIPDHGSVRVWLHQPDDASVRINAKRV